MTDSSHPVFALARRSLEKGYGRRAVMIGSGGTIPFAAPMSEALGDIPALLVGMFKQWTVEITAHGENESLHLGDFQKAIKGQIHLFYDLLQNRFIFNK